MRTDPSGSGSPSRANDATARVLATALRVARERPEAPIICLTPHRSIAQRMAVVWGLHAMVAADAHSMSEATSRAVRVAQTEGFAQHGDVLDRTDRGVVAAEIHRRQAPTGEHKTGDLAVDEAVGVTLRRRPPIPGSKPRRA